MGQQTANSFEQEAQEATALGDTIACEGREKSLAELKEQLARQAQVHQQTLAKQDELYQEELAKRDEFHQEAQKCFELEERKALDDLLLKIAEEKRRSEEESAREDADKGTDRETSGQALSDRKNSFEEEDEMDEPK